jgi:hypothetical protein
MAVVEVESPILRIELDLDFTADKVVRPVCATLP